MRIDLNRIQEQFNRVIEYSQDIGEPNTNDILLRWSHAKKKFIDKWGGLTYELDRDIVLDMPEEDKQILFQDFVSDSVVFSDRGEEVKVFLASQGIDGFFENKVKEKFEMNGIKVNAGAKVSKSLKFFFTSSPTMLDKFQTRMSRIIQDCKITGRMVMSVHPLDFLSSSETAHNWHSCHALDGEYRAGNLSYILDNHTFMIYIKADKDYKLPSFPSDVMWNSKKWRVLMYMGENEEILVSGRQYPFVSECAFNIATEEVLGKFYNVVKYEWKSVANNISTIMEDGIGSLQYNDCLNSPTYRPVACFTPEFQTSYFNDEFKTMTIGEAVPCLECGGMNISITDDFRCDDCGDYCYCEHCGDACRSDDLYELEGDMICETCFDENGVFCEGCCETFNEFKTEMYWDEETSCYYCEDCYDDLMETRADQPDPEPYGEL